MGYSELYNRKRRILSFLCVCVLTAGCILFIHQMHGRKALPHPGFGQLQDSSAKIEDEDSSLPFSLSGIEFNAPVIAVSEGSSWLPLNNTWSFGGDFSLIGSFPLDESKVFGSLSKTPKDLESYSPAIIQDGSVVSLTPHSNLIDGDYYEPQDGYGTDEFIVWRSGELAHSIDGVNDNWALQAYDSTNEKCITIDTSYQLNGTKETPRLPGEIVPTFNNEHICFASNVLIDGEWIPQIIVYDREEDYSRHLLAYGNYPCASKSQILYAGYSREELLYNQLIGWDGETTEEIFSIDESGSWSISGIWSSPSVMAVSISEDSSLTNCEEKGTYIGFWNKSSMKPLIWIHVHSPSVLGSINDNWFVWGSGSQNKYAGMYGLNLNTNNVYLLGETKGYSRPKIAVNSNAVLLPVLKDGLNAVQFDLGELASD